MYTVIVQFKTALKSILLIKQKLLLDMKSYCLSISVCLILKKHAKKYTTQIIEFYTLIIIYMVLKVLLEDSEAIFLCSLLLTKQIYSLDKPLELLQRSFKNTLKLIRGHYLKNEIHGPERCLSC